MQLQQFYHTNIQIRVKCIWLKFLRSEKSEMIGKFPSFKLLLKAFAKLYGLNVLWPHAQPH